MVIAAKNVWELPGKLSGGTIICPSASAKTRRQPLPLLIRLDVVSLISSPFKKNRLPANFIRTRTSQAAIVRRTIIRFKLAKTRQHGANANANPGISTYCDMEKRKKKFPTRASSLVNCDDTPWWNIPYTHLHAVACCRTRTILFTAVKIFTRSKSSVIIRIRKPRNVRVYYYTGWYYYSYRISSNSRDGVLPCMIIIHGYGKREDVQR